MALPASTVQTVLTIAEELKAAIHGVPLPEGYEIWMNVSITLAVQNNAVGRVLINSDVDEEPLVDFQVA